MWSGPRDLRKGTELSRKTRGKRRPGGKAVQNRCSFAPKRCSGEWGCRRRSAWQRPKEGPPDCPLRFARFGPPEQAADVGRDSRHGGGDRMMLTASTDIEGSPHTRSVCYLLRCTFYHPTAAGAYRTLARSLSVHFGFAADHFRDSPAIFCQRKNSIALLGARGRCGAAGAHAGVVV